MALVQSETPASWSQGEDPKAFTDKLMSQLEMDETEVARFLFETSSRHASPGQAMENLKEQFPHLPSIDFTPGDRALQLVSEAKKAIEANKQAAAEKCIHQALLLDSNCVDAYLLQADLLSDEVPIEERETVLQKAIDAGKTIIGSQADFDELVGQFWGCAETRPYMTALERLAWVNWMAPGRQAQGIQHAQAMLKLNPNDNQGIRQSLLYWLMVENRWDEAQQLWTQYDEADDAWWLYGQYFLTANRDGVEAKSSKKRFDEALDFNPFVPLFLLGETPNLMESMTQGKGYYSPGDPSEASEMVKQVMLAHTPLMHNDPANNGTIPRLLELLGDQMEQMSQRKLDNKLRKATSAFMARMITE